MTRSAPVSAVMSTDVVAFSPDDPVDQAMRTLVARQVDGGPVVDADGAVVGMLSTDDLIVQESRLHFPTVIELFGAVIELPGQARRFDEDIRRALGSTVAEVMSTEVHVVASDDTLETAATRMHEHQISRLPVVDDGRLVGIVSRSDIIKSLLADFEG